MFFTRLLKDRSDPTDLQLPLGLWGTGKVEIVKKTIGRNTREYTCITCILVPRKIRIMRNVHYSYASGGFISKVALVEI